MKKQIIWFVVNYIRILLTVVGWELWKHFTHCPNF